MTLFSLHQVDTVIEEDVVDEDIKIFYLCSKAVVVAVMGISRIRGQIKRIATRLLLVQTERLSQMSFVLGATSMGITIIHFHMTLKLVLYLYMLGTCVPRTSLLRFQKVGCF